MGKQQTNFFNLRSSVFVALMLLVCLSMSFGFSLVIKDRSNANVQASSSDVYYWGIDGSNGLKVGPLIKGDAPDTYYITNGGQLAYLNYLLTESGKTSLEDGNAEDYSGCTFVLRNHIKLNSYLNQFGEVVNPLWVPISIGKNGKNRNITFDGNGFSISGLHIQYEADETPRNVGFFEEMYGGVFKNVTFKNPVIEYEYKGESLAKDDQARLDSPTEIGVGVIAGSIDSTYIENVTIENPSITVTTENLNGHNFYVGTAVGKMGLTTNLVNEDGNTVRKTVNSVTPTNWGMDTVNVLKTDDTSTGVTFTVNAGSEDDVTYGEAFNAYLGGLTGVNVNSKIINSTLRGVTINPNYQPLDVDSKLSGNYYVGGLAGLSTQIISNRDLVVAAGLYNNLLVNVSLGDIRSVTDNYFCGNLVGRVYSGGWVYNNMVVGAMPYADFWGEVYNAIIYVTSLDDDEVCIGNVIGGVDKYYFAGQNTGTNDVYNCNIVLDNPVDPDEDNNTDVDVEYFSHCKIHQYDSRDLITASDKSATAEKMKQYNFCFSSTSELSGFNFDLMNEFKDEEGYLYHAIQPMIKYEVGLTINEINDAGEETSDRERSIQAIYQFRDWELDESTNEPKITDFSGLDQYVVFEAGSPMEDVNAYWLINNSGYTQEVGELTVGRTYQVITEPEEPQCEGHEFKGWKIKGLEKRADNSELWDCLLNEKGYIDNDGFYQFDKEEIGEYPDRRFVAVWERLLYKVTFYDTLSDEVYAEDDVYYADKISKPEDPDSTGGYKFAGWFVVEQEIGSEVDLSQQWIFDSEENKMPAKEEGFVLYSAWIDKIEMLRVLLEDESYQSYNENYNTYFDKESGQRFANAFSAAMNVKEGDGDAGTLLTELENAYNALRVDPQKILNLPAYNNDLIENYCPFLYKDEARLRYQTFKQSVKQDIESKDFDRTKIDEFIRNYNELNSLYNNLKNNLNPSISVDINSERISTLIQKYRNLKSKYDTLNEDDYTNDSLAQLERAYDDLDVLWNAESGDPDLKEVELAVDAFGASISGLVPLDSVSNEDGESGRNSGSKMPISPIAIGIIIVLMCMAGVGGYIGYDIFKHKNLLIKTAKVVKGPERVEHVQPVNPVVNNYAEPVVQVQQKEVVEDDEDEGYF